MSAIAIIPARGGSKRLPRKNILPMHGRPMLGWPVQAALESRIFSHIIVSTEDSEVAEIALAQGARVIFRPIEMATDTAHEYEAYRHVLGTLAEEGVFPDCLCGIYPTAILIEPDDLRQAHNKIFAADADVVVGVSPYGIHPYKALEPAGDGYLKRVYPVECMQRSQTFPHYVASNGTFYMMRTAAFLKNPTYYPEKMCGHEMPAYRTIDLDTEDDYKMAQVLMGAYLERKSRAV